MEKLVDLKLSKKEAEKDYGAPATASDDLPKYPYGSRLDFDTEAVEKLGIQDYEVGETCAIEARGVVIRKSESQTQGSDENCHIEIQITKILVGPDKKAKKQKAEGEHLNSISSPTYSD